MTSVALSLLDTSLFQFHFHFHPFPLTAEDSFVAEGVTLRRNILSSCIDASSLRDDKVEVVSIRIKVSESYSVRLSVLFMKNLSETLVEV